MRETEYIKIVMVKQLQGLATPQEQQALQLWLLLDADHQQEYDELAAIWQKSAELLGSQQFNADQAWQKVDQALARSAANSIPRPAKVIALFTFQRIAAAAVLVVVALGSWWWYRSSAWQTLAATTQNETVLLPDQSTVLLRKGSSLRYPAHFNSSERHVELSGEAYFQVQHKAQQPFRITTAHAEVQVLGTSFLVHSQPVADEVVVTTGKVSITDKQQTGNQVIINAGQRAVLQQNHFTQNPVTDSNFIAWETGSLNFKNASLAKVLQDLEHYYGVPVTIDQPAQVPDSIRITVRFQHQPLEQVLEEISLITGLKLSQSR